MIVNILHSNIKIDGNELAFLFPLRINRKRLRREYNIILQFHGQISEKLWECDVLIISSWHIGRNLRWWKDEIARVHSFLREAKSKVKKVIWFDISDSTGTTQFSVLPYVDIYLKCQVLKDRNQYLKEFYANRIFSDFYHKEYNVKDADAGEAHLKTIPAVDDLCKISVGWNTGMANYSCYGPYWSRIRHYLANIDLPLFYPTTWAAPNSDRPIQYSCRVGYSYSRDTVAYQRKKIAKVLKDKIPVGKLKRPKYFSELENSRLCISPFGLGEITLRDFEIIVSGAAIFKANCDHMETWPDLFIKNETYIDYDWRLSDFEEKLVDCAARPSLCRTIAENCQEIYKSILTTEDGHHNFCQRFESIISD